MSIISESEDIATMTINHYERILRERDEARETLADWENAAAHVEADHPDETHCGCVSVLRKLLHDARSERDEAREHLSAAKHFLVKYIAERDEAREALREIWQSGDAFLPHVDEATTNRWRRAAGWAETK